MKEWITSIRAPTPEDITDTRNCIVYCMYVLWVYMLLMCVSEHMSIFKLFVQFTNISVSHSTPAKSEIDAVTTIYPLPGSSFMLLIKHSQNTYMHTYTVKLLYKIIDQWLMCIDETCGIQLFWSHLTSTWSLTQRGLWQETLTGDQSYYLETQPCWPCREI